MQANDCLRRTSSLARRAPYRKERCLRLHVTHTGRTMFRALAWGEASCSKEPYPMIGG